jgi:hypothetical protein
LTSVSLRAASAPRDDKDAAKDLARDLAEIASHIGQLKGDANAYRTDPNYNTVKLRLLAQLQQIGYKARRGRPVD